MIPILQIATLSQVTKLRLEHKAFLKTCSPNYYNIMSHSFGKGGFGRGRVSLWGVCGGFQMLLEEERQDESQSNEGRLCAFPYGGPFQA